MKKNELKELVKEEIQNIINEFDIKDGNDDNEGEMSKSELLYIADKAGKIAEKITADDQPIEAWVQSHISAAKELISHVADYVGYGEEEAGDESEVESTEEPMEEPMEQGDKLKEMTQSALDKKKKTQFSSKYDDKFSDKRKNLPDSLQKSILKKQGNLEEDSKKELTVKKLQADKFKEDIKDFAANNEHGKILKLIKKLEDYVKTHKSKGEN